MGDSVDRFMDELDSSVTRGHFNIVIPVPWEDSNDIAAFCSQNRGRCLLAVHDWLDREIARVVTALGIVANLDGADDRLKDNSPFAIACVTSDPFQIKFVGKKIRGDSVWWEAALRASGLSEEGPRLIDQRIVQSVRYAFGEKSSDISTKVHLYIMNKDPFSLFFLYNPSFNSKAFCGPCKSMITSLAWPCRGECNLLVPCHPTPWIKARFDPTVSNDHCWRFSFGSQLTKARATRGFMLQVCEYNTPWPSLQLGEGQQIEFVMAQYQNVKTIRIFVGKEATDSEIEGLCDQLASEVRFWMDTGRNDDALVEISVRGICRFAGWQSWSRVHDEERWS